MTQLQTTSLIGLLIYFAVLLFAVSKDKKNANVLDYFFAGRSLPFWALSITFIASWWGAGSALSTADLAYSDGLGAFWYYGVPVLLSTFLMILGAKAIRRVGYLTQGKMMAARYSPLVSKILSVMILIFMTFSAFSQMVGIGNFFGTYLGLNYELAVLVGTGIVLIHSLFGGFRGVVLTDIIQFVLLLLSAIGVFVVAFTRAGGFPEISAAAALAGKDGYMSLTAGVKIFQDQGQHGTEQHSQDKEKHGAFLSLLKTFSLYYITSCPQKKAAGSLNLFIPGCPRNRPHVKCRGQIANSGWLSPKGYPDILESPDARRTVTK